MSGSTIARASALLLSLSLATGAASAAISPLTPLAGSWSGGGMLTMSNGEQQPLRCRAAYDVAGRGSALRLNLRCASDSYNFDLASQVEYRRGQISGQWSEATRHAAGIIEGRAAGDRIEAAARGQNFSADLSVTTRGNRQYVAIHPEGTAVRSVSFALNRR